MARKPRLHLPATFHHVILRGNDGQQIFFSDEDRYRFYLLLQEGCERFKHRILAFCLMTNHIHLAIQIAEIPLSKIIQNVSFRYTCYINKKLHRVGHLFQGRFKSILVDAENYLTTLIRYIHRNPIRAGIVEQPEAYRWSSHRAYLGREDVAWLTTQTVLQKFGDTLPSAVKQFEQFVVRESEFEDTATNYEKGIYKGMLIDEDTFVSSILTKMRVKKDKEISLEFLVEHVCRFYCLSPKVLSQPGRIHKHSTIRGIIALLSLKSHNITLSEVASFFGRDLSTISRVAVHLQEKSKSDGALANELKDLEQFLKDATTQA